MIISPRRGVTQEQTSIFFFFLIVKFEDAKCASLGFCHMPLLQSRYIYCLHMIVQLYYTCTTKLIYAEKQPIRTNFSWCLFNYS